MIADATMTSDMSSPQSNAATRQGFIESLGITAAIGGTVVGWAVDALAFAEAVFGFIVPVLIADLAWRWRSDGWRVFLAAISIGLSIGLAIQWHQPADAGLLT